MRFDLVAYVIAIICFVVGIFIPFQLGVNLIPTALLIVFMLFGFFFIMFGYSLRPRRITPYVRLKTEETKPSIAPQEPIKELPVLPTVPSPEAKPLKTELTSVKGIGSKRASQLRDIGILTPQDLAKASAAEIAMKLKVSEKIVEKWIREAKTLEKQA